MRWKASKFLLPALAHDARQAFFFSGAFFFLGLCWSNAQYVMAGRVSVLLRGMGSGPLALLDYISHISHII